MRESFISIGWRLIPYWLNNWEQQWGAECSSMMFELPQFAVELIIILPCVQILCSRMKVLAMPSVNAALPRGWDGASAEQIQEAFVPNVQRGCWERRPEQRHIRQRLRYALLMCCRWYMLWRRTVPQRVIHWQGQLEAVCTVGSV